MVAYYDTVTKNFYNFELGGVLPSVTDDFVVVDANQYYELLGQTYLDSTKGITYDGGLTLFTIPPPTFTQSQNILNFVGMIKTFINDVATSYQYSSIQDAISYYDSGVTAWRNEAIIFNTWRDNTENLMFQNIRGYTADGINLPTLSGFTGQVGYVPLGLTSPSRFILS